MCSVLNEFSITQQAAVYLPGAAVQYLEHDLPLSRSCSQGDLVPENLMEGLGSNHSMPPLLVSQILMLTTEQSTWPSSVQGEQQQSL